jgi:anti-sigma factor RsiW
MLMSEHDRIEALLRASRPEPDREFERRLERRLLGASRGAPGRARHFVPRLAWRPALAGAGAAGLLATAVLAAGLAGTGPLSGSDDGARARDDCHYVTVRRPGKVPVVVATKDGGSRIVYRRGMVTKRVKRCP